MRNGDTVAPCAIAVYRSVHSANTYTLVATTTATNPTTYADTSSAVASGGASWDYEIFTQFTPSGGTTLTSTASNTATIAVPPLPGPATGVAASAAGQN